MKQEPNQVGGESIWLKPSESLTDVPATHQSLITSEIRTAFASPKEYFLALAARTPLPGFQNYLQQLVTDGGCALFLATADEMFGGPSAFQYLSHENVKAYSLGSVTDALNWIFDELRQGRTPEFDYGRIK